MSQPTQSNPADVIRQLQAQGDPASMASAAELQALHYDRQMAGLCGDVYESAKGVGEPDPGWTRASEDPEQLAAIAQQLGIDGKALKAMLRPTDSGFRAEIYLPDPAVLGPGFKPVLVFKGSAGEVQDPSNTDSGLRSTAAEDFLANNFPQSIGMESDYYTRAMRLGKLLKDKGFDFDLAGHSLAGGMASAASVVTGVRATTYNAAGLHPATTERFAKDNPGVQLHDPRQLVTAYQIRGEVLNDGLQYNIDRLDKYQRATMAGIFSHVGYLAHELPEVRTLTAAALEDAMPKAALENVQAFIKELASADTDALLRDLPLAVGQVKPLDMPMTRQDPNDPNSPLIPRREVLDLQGLTDLSAVTLQSVNRILATTRAVHDGAELAPAAAGVAAAAVEGAGDVTRAVLEAQGKAAKQTLHGTGVVAAAALQTHSAGLQTVQSVAGALHAGTVDAVTTGEAAAQRTVGRGLQTASRWMPNAFGLRDWVEEKGEQMLARADRIEKTGEVLSAGIRDAAAASARNTRDAMDVVTLETVTVTAKAGDKLEQQHARNGAAIDTLGEQGQLAVRALGEQAQSHLTMVAAGTIATVEANRIPVAANYVQTTVLGLPSSAEANGRHGMDPTVIPTFDRQMQQMLDKAQRQVHGAPEQAQPAKPLPEQQAARGFSAADQALFDRIRGAVPGHVDDAVIGHAVVQVKRSGMLEMGGMAGVTLREDRLFIAGATAGFRVSVDVREPVADLQSSQHAAATLDRQQTQERAAAVPRTQDAPVFA